MSSSGDLRARLIGTVYFLPLIAALAYGHPFSAVAGCLAIGWVAFEAVFILSGGQVKTADRLLIALILAVFWLAFLPVTGIGLVLIGAGLCGAGLLFVRGREAAFISLLFFASLSLGALLAANNGHYVLICLAAVISAGDVGAYICGRLLGGPKLAPRISPSKTWSGAVGGLVSSLLVVGLLLVLFDQAGSDAVGWGFAVLVSLLAQSGDLFESRLKRRLGVKDSGTIVPGHGGALDRFDGYLTVLPVVMLADAAGFTPFWLKASGL